MLKNATECESDLDQTFTKEVRWLFLGHFWVSGVSSKIGLKSNHPIKVGLSQSLIHIEAWKLFQPSCQLHYQSWDSFKTITLVSKPTSLSKKPIKIYQYLKYVKVKLTRSEATCKVCFSGWFWPSEFEIKKANKAINIGPHLAILFVTRTTVRSSVNLSNFCKI